MRSSADVLAIVVAGGAGARFGGEVPKQFLPLAGRPMVRWAIEPFLKHPSITRVTLVVPLAYADAPPDWLVQLRRRGLTIVPGGAERTDSVRHGLETVDGRVDRVMVHDGARPLVTPEIITRVLDAVRAGRGAIAARPITDTVKAAGEGDRIVRTVDRTGLWRAETPQAFPREMLTNAHRRAVADGITGSDCASLCERYGSEIVLVRIDEPNLKITSPADLELAEAWLKHRDAAVHPTAGRGP